MNAADLRDPDHLASWLKERPSAVTTGLAVRALLRVLPAALWTLAEADQLSASDRRVIVLPVFRCLAVGWNTMRPSHETGEAMDWPAIGQATGDAARPAVGAAADASYPAFAMAAGAISVVRGKDDALGCADGAHAAFDSTAARADVATDAAFIDAANAPAVGLAQLAARPLWPDAVPDLIQARWAKLRETLLAADEDWDVWTDWWEARRDGLASVAAAERWRTLGDPAVADFWQQTPAAINQAIKKVL